MAEVKDYKDTEYIATTESVVKDQESDKNEEKKETTAEREAKIAAEKERRAVEALEAKRLEVDEAWDKAKPTTQKEKALKDWAKERNLTPADVAEKKLLPQFEDMWAAAQENKEKQAEEVLLDWQNVLSSKDYDANESYLRFLAMQGTDVKRFIATRTSEWSAYFPNTRLSEVMKKKGLVSILLKVAKKIFMPLVADVQRLMMTPYQHKKFEEERELLAKAAWELADEQRAEAGKAVSLEEARSEQYTAEMGGSNAGFPPVELMDQTIEKYSEDEVAQNSAISDEDKKDRGDAAQGIINVILAKKGRTLLEMKEEDIDVIQKIHEWGRDQIGKDNVNLASVGNYKWEQLLHKGQELRKFLKEKGITDKETRNEIMESLFESGVLGMKKPGAGDREPLTGEQDTIYQYNRALFNMGYSDLPDDYPEVEEYIYDRAVAGKKMTEEEVQKYGEAFRDNLIQEAEARKAQDPRNEFNESQKSLYDQWMDLFDEAHIPGDAVHHPQNVKLLISLIKGDIRPSRTRLQELIESNQFVIPGAGKESGEERQNRLVNAERQRQSNETWDAWEKKHFPEGSFPNDAQARFLMYLREHNYDPTQEGLQKLILQMDSQHDLTKALNVIGAELDPNEEYYGRNIESIEDLVFAIVEYDTDQEYLWGPDGLFPLYSFVYEEDASQPDGIRREWDEDRKEFLPVPQTQDREHVNKGKGKKNKATGKTDKEAKIRANPGNFHKWVMHQVNYWNGEMTYDPINFMQQITLFRRGGRGAYSLGNMLQYKNTFLKTKVTNEKNQEEDYVVNDLYDQLWKDIKPYEIHRNAHLEYLPIMGEAKESSSFMSRFHSKNEVTRAIYNKQSYFRWQTYTPEHFVSSVEKAGWDKAKLKELSAEDKERQDGKVGAASALAELVYRNLINIGRPEEDDGSMAKDNLISLLGSDSIFFQKKEILKMRDSLNWNIFNETNPEKAIPSKDINAIFPSEMQYKKDKANSFAKITNNGRLKKALEEFSEAKGDKAKKLLDENSDLRRFLEIDDPETLKRYVRDDEQKGVADFFSTYMYVPNPDTADGEPKVRINRRKFVSFFNVFDAPQQDPYRTALLQAMVGESVAHRHKLFIEDGKIDPITRKRKYATKDSSETWYVKQITEVNGKKKYKFVPLKPRDENETDEQAKARVMAANESVWIMDGTARDFAQNEAWYSLRWKGIAALNDPDGTGHDWQERAFYAMQYRLKGPTRKRNNNSGALSSFGAFQGTIMDFMRGVQTLAGKSKHTDGKYGIAVPVKENGEKVKLGDNFAVPKEEEDKITYEYEQNKDGEVLYKTPLDVLQEIVRAVDIAEDDPEIGGVMAEAAADPMNKEKAKRAAEAEIKRQEILRQLTAQFRFMEQTQEKYYGDHWVRGHKIMEEQLLGEARINFTEIWKYELGPVPHYEIDMSKFRQQFEDMTKPWRYGISTWKQLDLEQRIDIPDPKRKGEMKYVIDQHGNKVKPFAAQKFFGDEVLDHPQFWKIPDPNNSKEMGEAVWVDITDADGNVKKEKRIPHLIDPALCNTEQGKIQLYINATLMQIGSDIMEHRKLKFRNSRYGDEFVFAMIDSLRNLPADVLGDEIMSMASIHARTNAISEADIKWLMGCMQVSEGRIAFLSIMKAILKGSWEGAVKGSQIASKATFNVLTT